MADRLEKLWGLASEKDSTLHVPTRDLQSLRKKFLYAETYSRSRAFTKMAKGEIGIFRGVPVPIKDAVTVEQRRRALLEGLKRGFPKAQTANVQQGGKRSYMPVSKLIKCWEDESRIVSVTDLHFRDTKFDKLVDTSELSDFNVLCNDARFGQELMEKIEMMTLVISARGNVTDSHTDDCDGTNHCFLGKKLWLAWDRVEGQRKGLQDNTRDDVQDRAAFDMRAFLSIPDARLFVIKADDTLFLPGNLAHKVVTLEHYIGAGSFYVTLPGALRTLVRWHLHGTTDVHRKRLLLKITKAVIERALGLRDEPLETQERWGLRFLCQAVRKWDKKENRKAKELLLSKPGFAQFIEAALTQ